MPERIHSGGRAPAWLGYAINDNCATIIPEIPLGINGNNQR